MKFKELSLFGKMIHVAFWILVAIFLSPIILGALAIVLGIIGAILAIAFIIGLALLPFALVWYLAK